MNRIRRWTIYPAALLAAGLLSSLGGSLRSAAQDDAASPREVIVSWSDLTPFDEKERATRQAGGIAGRHFRIVNASVVRLPDAVAEQILRQHPNVERIVPKLQAVPRGRTSRLLAARRATHVR